MTDKSDDTSDTDDRSYYYNIQLLIVFCYENTYTLYKHWPKVAVGDYTSPSSGCPWHYTHINCILVYWSVYAFNS